MTEPTKLRVDILSYREMCDAENIQTLLGYRSVILLARDYTAHPASCVLNIAVTAGNYMHVGVKHCLPSIHADVSSNVESSYLTINFSYFDPRLTK